MSVTCQVHRTPVNPVFLAVFFGVIIAINLAYRAWRSRIKNAKYDLTQDGGKIVFKSHLGVFTLDRSARTFEASYVNNQTVKLSFDQIRNIEIITEDVEAMLQEMVFEGFTLFIDSQKKYRDIVQKYSIVVITNEYKRFPLIAMSQYTVKDLLNLAVTLQLDLLAMLRMYMPVDLYTQNLYQKFKDFLNKDFRFDKEI